MSDHPAAATNGAVPIQADEPARLLVHASRGTADSLRHVGLVGADA
jgi:hypothetical protein